MPEQLTKHTEVTLQVLQSGGAQCASGAVPEILTRCPAEHFCKLPGGEVCVYGFADAPRMTQPGLADWQALAQPVAPPAVANGSAWLLHGGNGLLLGLAIGAVLPCLDCAYPQTAPRRERAPSRSMHWTQVIHKPLGRVHSSNCKRPCKRT
jgi:hypothetical protein